MENVAFGDPLMTVATTPFASEAILVVQKSFLAELEKVIVTKTMNAKRD